jgi:ATP-dependent Lhr-like helicase
MPTTSDALSRFSESTRTWFAAAFAEPTPAQVGAWDAIAHGKHALVVAPTGSGKTLSAFLWSIDRLLTHPRPVDRTERTRVLYVSPLKALAVDVERNLRSPLVGIRNTAERLDQKAPDVTVGVRSGDTTAADRRKLVSTPPDVLITTPESLFLMLTSQARESLRGVETVIVDEVHAVAGTKRGCWTNPRSVSGSAPPSAPSRRWPGSSAATRRSRSSHRRARRSGTSRSSSPSRT